MCEGPYVTYGDPEEEDGGALFRRVCPTCNRFVKADGSTTFRHLNGREDKPNATCSVHGRVVMPFEGYY